MQTVLQDALALRKRCNSGDIGEHGLASAGGRLGRLLDAPPPLARRTKSDRNPRAFRCRRLPASTGSVAGDAVLGANFGVAVGGGPPLQVSVPGLQERATEARRRAGADWRPRLSRWRHTGRAGWRTGAGLAFAFARQKPLRASCLADAASASRPGAAGAADLPGLWTPGRHPRRIRGTSASWPSRVRHGRAPPSPPAATPPAAGAALAHPDRRRQQSHTSPAPSNGLPIAPSPTGQK